MRASENQSNRFSRVAMELELILERELTTQRPPGGTMTDVHVCQHESGKWHINVRVSWRGTALYHVGLYDKKRIRLYKKASSAIRHIVLGYGYEGVIHVHPFAGLQDARSEEHTSELQSLMRISYAVFCLKKKKNIQIKDNHNHHN